MTRTNDYNFELYYLGKICKNNHVFAKTSNSLRQKSNRTCIECQKNITKKYKTNNYQLCNKRIKRWRGRIAENKTKNLPAEKQCCVCHQWKSSNSFYPAKYSADGLCGHCKVCDKKRQSDARELHRRPRIPKDPEIVRENKRKAMRRYKNSVKGKLANAKAHHRRKAILLQVEFRRYTPTQILSRFAEFGDECVYCCDNKKLTVDHFFPITKFGADSLENIVPACAKCNSSKNNRDPEIWFKSQSFFSNEKWQMLVDKTNFDVNVINLRRACSKFGLGLSLYDQNK